MTSTGRNRYCVCSNEISAKKASGCYVVAVKKGTPRANIKIFWSSMGAVLLSAVFLNSDNEWTQS